MSKFKQRLTTIGVAAALSASAVMVAVDAQAAPGKFLIGWASDMMLDGNNCSALDDVLGLRGLNPGGIVSPNNPTPSSPVDCKGLLPDADFLAVIDADPSSATYGKVVNTAEMPAVNGQHLLSVTEDFVDDALDIAIGNAGDPNHLGNPNGVMDDDLLGGVPNMFAGTGLDPHGLGLDGVPIVPAPSSVLNEAHHHSVLPFIDNGKVYSYYGGIISANIFGCDITDPMNIVAAPNTMAENLPLHANGNNLCGLSVSGGVYNQFTGTDDLEFDPVGGSYFTTMMGAGGGFSATGTVALSLPPVLTTPGGIQELEPLTGAIFEYSAIPTAPVYGHGTFTGAGPKGTISDTQGFYANAAPGEMLGPKRYAPRVDMVTGGLDGNGECQPAVGDTAIADPATGFTTQIQAFNLCVPGVAPFNQLGPDTGAVDLSRGINEGPDTGILAHPHGIGIREDLNGKMADKNGNLTGTSQGIIMTSDYADPVSLAINGSGVVGANGHNLGTTVRFWDLANPQNGPYQVIQMPDGNRHEGRATMEEPEGLMAMRVTHGTNGSKGAFVASMCGGSIFYSPNITVKKPKFRLVYDFGTCTGASVFTLTQDDKFMFLPLAGIQVKGDPTHDRDYQGEHDRRIAVLDIRRLLSKGNSMRRVRCNKAPAWTMANVPQFIANWFPDLKSPLGQGLTLGAGYFRYNQRGDLNHRGRWWPNNSASDCPKLVDMVDFSGDGEDGIFGTADDHPDNETSRGGPHFTTHDRDDKYVATSNYFVDLRNFAIRDVGLLNEALGLGQAWCDSDISANTSTTNFSNGPANGHAHPPGGPNDGDYPAGGLGNVFDALGIPGVPAALTPGQHGCVNQGQANILPGTGSIGDDTICMMKWNRNRRNLKLDVSFNAGDPNSPLGCIDTDFGDTGTLWPANGTRNPGAGNASVHGMSFYNTDGQLRFFSNGTGQ
jgi:hypothetical protein